MKFVYGLVGLFVLNKLHLYRYVRPFKGLLVVAFLVYRFQNVDADNKSLLVCISDLIDELTAAMPKASVASGLVLKDLLALVLISTVIDGFNDLTNWNVRGFFKAITDWGFNLVKDLSFVKGTLAKEQDKLESSFDKELKVKSRALGSVNNQLPENGLSQTEILDLMKKATKSEDVVWEQGHVSGAVYYGKHQHIKFLNECFGYYSISNPLHPDIWPSVMKFESEIIAMTAALVNGGLSTVCGSTTSVRFSFLSHLLTAIMNVHSSHVCREVLKVSSWLSKLTVISIV